MVFEIAAGESGFVVLMNEFCWYVDVIQAPGGDDFHSWQLAMLLSLRRAGTLMVMASSGLSG